MKVPEISFLPDISLVYQNQNYHKSDGLFFLHKGFAIILKLNLEKKKYIQFKKVKGKYRMLVILTNYNGELSSFKIETITLIFQTYRYVKSIPEMAASILFISGFLVMICLGWIKRSENKNKN